MLIDGMNKAKVITITSVKGGVGKTTTVLNLAGIYALENKKVLILDLDLFSASVSVLLNLNPVNDIYSMTDDMNNNRYEDFTDYVTKYNENIDVIGGPKDIRMANKVDARFIPIIISKASLKYDVIIIDLHDPNNSSLARLYSREFYKIVKKKLAYQGVMVTQATSPFFSPEAYWCINESVKASGFNHTYPYHVYVPAFGDWGFIMGSNIKYDTDKIDIKTETKFIDNEVIKNAFKLEKDVQRDNIQYSTLDRPKILEYYLNGWRYWN